MKPHDNGQTAQRNSSSSSEQNNAAVFIYQQLRQLETRINESRRIGKYGEAQNAQSRLEQLKTDEEARHLLALKHKQEQELRQLELEQVKEFEEFSHQWQETIATAHRRSNAQTVLLQQKQHSELLGLEEQLDAKKFFPKFSNEYLNLRRIEYALSQRGDFRKAEKVQQQADEMEKQEVQQLEAEHTEKLRIEKARLLSQHEREAERLKTKIMIMYHELYREQLRKSEQMLKKHQASRSALQRTHAAERLQASTLLRGCLGIKRVEQQVPPLPHPSEATTPTTATLLATKTKQKERSTFSAPNSVLNGNSNPDQADLTEQGCAIAKLMGASTLPAIITAQSGSTKARQTGDSRAYLASSQNETFNSEENLFGMDVAVIGNPSTTSCNSNGFRSTHELQAGGISLSDALTVKHKPFANQLTQSKSLGSVDLVQGAQNELPNSRYILPASKTSVFKTTSAGKGRGN